MEKGIVQPPSHLPTAPPSYEEAVGNTGGTHVQSLSVNPPYPVGAAAMPMPMSMPMPMPMPYNQPPNQTTMPAASIYPNANQSTPQPRPEPNPVQQSEVRVIHQHLAYTLGPNPVKMTCTSCFADIKTTTISDHQPSAHICCIVLCLLGCCLCSCLPYCMNAFMSVHHFCPSCKSYIGTWKG